MKRFFMYCIVIIGTLFVGLSFYMFAKNNEDITCTVPQGETVYLNVEVENIRVNNPAPKPQIVVQSESGASKPSSQLSSEKVTGRNSLCPCGSGKKYKNCCGKNS